MENNPWQTEIAMFLRGRGGGGGIRSEVTKLPTKIRLNLIYENFTAGLPRDKVFKRECF